MSIRLIFQFKLARNSSVLALAKLLVGLTITLAQPSRLPVPEIITSHQGLPQAFVASILQDKQGFIWMATRDGICRYDGNTFKVFQPTANEIPSLSSSEIIKMALDQQGKIWIVSATGDLDRFDPAREIFVSVSRQPFYRQRIGSQLIESIYPDSQQKLWLCLRGQGLACLDLRSQQIHRYRHQPDKTETLGDDMVRSVVEDGTDKHILWVSTDTGLDRLDRRSGQFTHVRQQAGNPESLPYSPLKELCRLQNGTLLIRLNGYISVFDPQLAKVRRTYRFSRPELIWHWTPMVVDRKYGILVSQANQLFRLDEKQGLTELTRLPENMNIQCLFIDQSDVLWLGTNGGGVFKYNLKAGVFNANPYRVSFQSDLLTQQFKLTGLPVFSIGRDWAYQFRSTVDSSGKVWCNVRDVPFIRFNPSSRYVSSLPFAINAFPKNPTYPISMATDPAGRVWGLYDSLAAWYDEPQKRWIRFPYRFQYQPGGILSETIILDLVVDEQALWMISQSEGLFRVDRQTGAIRRYTHQPNNPFSLSSDKLLCLFADPADKAILWIGTFGSGLCRFDKRTGKSRRLTTADGLPNNVIYAAIPDRHGALWIATNQGLGRMDRRTFRTRIYTREDGLADDEFNRHHFLQTPDGHIFLGGLEGVTSFDPTNLQEDTYQPLVQITGVQINNRPMSSDAVPAQMLTELNLPYDKNFVTVQFAAMQYNRRNKLTYRYQLEGLETSWTETNRPIAVYTGLQPGEYTLRLNAANTDGLWSRHIRILRLTIKPPFWVTWWAYAVYVLTAGAIAYGLIRSFLNRLRLQQSVLLKQKEIELKQQEAEQLQQSVLLSQKEVVLKQQETEQLRAANEMKTRFFANITHEFRTPLTLILAPTEQMVSENLEPRNQRRLVTIEQNAHQLLRLINQLLDLSKLEASVMPVHESRGDLTECLTHWLQPLIEQARTQQLGLTFSSNVTGHYNFDAEKLERIVYNLVANALKFTRAGQITVTLTTLSDGVQLTVADTGIGIPAQNLPHIFDRFYQVGPRQGSGHNTDVISNPGTGIGLALVKELVLLQKGRITVDSTLQEGTAFVVELPYRKLTTPDVAANTTGFLPIESSLSFSEESDAARILIVEDNHELAHFIAESLPPQYHIRRAINGMDGLKQALNDLPDLIISDVLMPVQAGPQMDGYTLCNRLKTDLRTSHIPVILLTAKVAIEDRMEGLSQGADAYINKPFYVEELRLRVHNLLEQRHRQREWLRHMLSNADARQEQPVPTDPFLARFYELIERNLDNTLLSVESLADQLALSRSHLHRKVKALTGFSANELIRTYRLKAATQLLRNGTNSAETANRTGFDSPQYFAKCFRELYGLTPTEFVRKQHLPPTPFF